MRKFRDLLKQCLTTEEITTIEAKVRAEIAEREAVAAAQQQIAAKVEQYMRKTKTNFKEMVAFTGFSPAQMNKICKGQANLRLSNLMHLAKKIGHESPLNF